MVVCSLVSIHLMVVLNKPVVMCFYMSNVQVFGGKMLPADSVREYSQLREFRVS